MMAGDSQRVMETTTITYNGMIAVLDPTSSWAAKWLHIGAQHCRTCLRFCSCSFAVLTYCLAGSCALFPASLVCLGCALTRLLVREQASGCQAAMHCECRQTCRSILR